MTTATGNSVFDPCSKRNNRTRLSIEKLEDRTLPSATPTALATVHDLFNLGERYQTFSVAYSGESSFNLKTIDNNDIYVTGPKGFSRNAELVGIQSTGGIDPVAYYRIKAPGGLWTRGDYGAYDIHLRANQVKTVDQDAVPAQTLGTFLVRSASTLALQHQTDTLFLLQGNKSLKGAHGERPVVSQGVSFALGVSDSAIHFSASNSLQYATAGNLSSTDGTIEFWIRPDWNGDEQADHLFLQVGEQFNNGMLLAIDAANNLRTIVWGDDPTTPDVEHDVERGVATSGFNWVAGQWHHFATTWQASTHELSLYIDGNLVDSISNNISIPSFATSNFSIGADLGGNRSSLATIDELRISNSAHSSSEVAAAYRAGYRLTGIQLINLPATITRGDTFQVAVYATTSLGTVIDVTPMTTLKTSDPHTLSIDSLGNVRALRHGVVLLGASLDGLKLRMLLKVNKG